jgi:hypothetical protein
MNRRDVLFEGLTEDEILKLPTNEVDGLIFLGEPLVFRAGSATILGSFRVIEENLVIELAQIDGGGEGVLIALGSLARRYAIMHNLSDVEWIVHAVSCAKPNLKLRKILERRGFVVQQLAGIGSAYHLIDRLIGEPGPDRI